VTCFTMKRVMAWTMTVGRGSSERRIHIDPVRHSF
jgi:hypothetical protein